MRVQRLGPAGHRVDYCVVFDADHDQVPVFTALGQWVGLADNPDAIATLTTSTSA
jgi:hypothetical protein